VPTKDEWDAERLSWTGGNNSAGAIASPLKLPAAGRRSSSGGSPYDVGTIGYYWSSTVYDTFAWNLYFFSANAGMSDNYRAFGFSVRCVQD